jgi:uncharacterized coiled-coil protein SlyX
MTSSPYNDFRNGIVGHDLGDERMEQVRELLIGDSYRRTEARLQYLETRMNDVEVGITRQLDALEARIEALQTVVAAERRSTLDELSNGLEELGQKIRTLSKT